MIGRMAAACPWVFARWRDPGLKVDHTAAWRRLCAYVAEDSEPAQALIRLKTIAPYFACNLFFGHRFFVAVHTAPDLAAVRERSERFFSVAPRLCRSVDVGGD